MLCVLQTTLSKIAIAQFSTYLRDVVHSTHKLLRKIICPILAMITKLFLKGGNIFGVNDSLQFPADEI